jgi:hypothetical protein
MVSGHKDRNHTEEIAVIIPVHDPQWCPATGPESADRRHIPDEISTASMVSGRRDRNQTLLSADRDAAIHASMVSGHRGPESVGLGQHLDQDADDASMVSGCWAG